MKKSKKKFKNEKKGITLISLVITIIILIILASVSIGVLVGNQGIFMQAKKAKLLTEVSSEKEAMELVMTLAQLESVVQTDSTYKIGIPLYDKTSENGNTWNIIMLNEKQQIYGTGWYFIEQGTFVEGYGKLQQDWLVNYEQVQGIPLEKNSYSHLSYESSLAITEGLVFNADPMNMADASSWGENVTLYGFEDNENRNWNENRISFDGKNDYIQVNGNMDVKDEITLEFYGKILDYAGDHQYIPLFCAYSNTSASDVEGNGMRMWSMNGAILANFGYSSCGNSEVWENINAQHNLKVKDAVNLNEEAMYTITYEHKNTTYTVYKNGKLLKQAKLKETYWENFKENEIPNIKYFQIGKVRWSSITGYLNGDMYAARIYNRCLTEEEVLQNYHKTVTYHKLQ
ncbi:MAG: sialidase domain-containing protein [Clostridia bacterium]